MIWVACAITLLVVLWPLLVEISRKPITLRQKQAPAENFAQLPQGKTFYRLSGLPVGPIVVCIHGLTTPSYIYEGLKTALVQAGFRVLTYDLYGRGLSDRPKALQDADFFCEQLETLLSHAKIDTSVTLIGDSMGASIAAHFTARHPKKVRHLIMTVPAGMRPKLGPIARLAMTVPPLGGWLIKLLYPRILRKGITKQRKRISSVQDIYDRQGGELRWRGFMPAVISSIRGILSHTAEDAHRTIATHNIPTLAVWGGVDNVVSVSGKETLEEWNPNVHQHVIDDAGHGLIHTHTYALANLILPHLTKTAL